jgi:Ser/Thr protein kinase RdoA (MazF antagonist)
MVTTETRTSHQRVERRFALQVLERFGLPNVSLRLHPPGRMPEAALRSELAWLATLAGEAALWVPEPVAAPDGETLVRCVSPRAP